MTAAGVPARTVLGALLFAAVLGLGLWTAWIAAANHREARALDRRMRACDALEVWNESLRHEVLAAEEALLEEPAARTLDPEGGA